MELIIQIIPSLKAKINYFYFVFALKIILRIYHFFNENVLIDPNLKSKLIYDGKFFRIYKKL